MTVPTPVFGASTLNVGTDAQHLEFSNAHTRRKTMADNIGQTLTTAG